MVIPSVYILRNWHRKAKGPKQALNVWLQKSDGLLHLTPCCLPTLVDYAFRYSEVVAFGTNDA